MSTSCDNAVVVSFKTAPDIPCETTPGKYYSSDPSPLISPFATSLFHVCCVKSLQSLDVPTNEIRK